MAPPPSAGDRSLLDRLHALKPTSVSWGTASVKKTTPSAAEAPAEELAAPVSPEDALAARLRSLRQEADVAVVKRTTGEAPEDPVAKAGHLGDVGDDADDPLHVSDDDQALHELLLDLAAQGDGDGDAHSAAGRSLSPFSLPDVPAGLTEEEDDSQQVADMLAKLAREAPVQPGAMHDEDDGSLRLPAVPTTSFSNVSSDPADDISARLAALRGLSGQDAGLGQTDAFGLPSAPTFLPGHRDAAAAFGRIGYTDADRQSWCVVCLEDAAVRCLGCDNDPYCARCWRDMHVGPAAGFDERGHKRVPLRKA